MYIYICITSQTTAKLSQKSPYIAGTFTAGNCYNEHNFLPLYSGQPIFFVEK